jgi:hypothetical protein
MKRMEMGSQKRRLGWVVKSRRMVFLVAVDELVEFCVD